MKKSCPVFYLLPVVFLLGLGGVVVAEANRQYDEYISEDVLAFVYAPDVAGAITALKETSAGKFFESSEMRGMADVFVKFKNLQMREKDSSVTWEELAGFLEQQVKAQCAVVVFSQAGSAAVFFDVADKPAFEEFLTEKFINEYKINFESQKYKNAEYKSLRLPPRAGNSCVYGYVGNTVAFTDSVEDFKEWVDSFSGQSAKPIARNPVYRKLKSELKKPVWIAYYNGEKAIKDLKDRLIDPDAMARRDVKNIRFWVKEEEKVFYEFIELFGLGSLNEIAFGVGVANGNIMGKGFVHMPTPVGVADLLKDAQKSETEALKIVPKDTSAVLTLSFSIADLYEIYMTIIKKIYNEATDARLKEIEDQENGLGVKFKDLLETLGDEMIVMADYDREKANGFLSDKNQNIFPLMKAGNAAVAVRLKEESKFKSMLNSMIKKLSPDAFVEEQYNGVQMMMLAGQVEAGYFIKNGWFVLGTKGELRSVIDTMKTPANSMAQDPEVRKLNSMLSSTRKCVYAYLDTAEFLDFQAMTYRWFWSHEGQSRNVKALAEIMPGSDVFYEYFSSCLGIIYYKDDLFVIDSVLPSERR